MQWPTACCSRYGGPSVLCDGPGSGPSVLCDGPGCDMEIHCFPLFSDMQQLFFLYLHCCGKRVASVGMEGLNDVSVCVVAR